MEGATGQTPDFYNPLIAGAVLLVFRQRESLARQEVRWPVWCAMALCGVALTIKQTTVFESVFIGMYVVGSLLAAGARFSRVLTVAAVCCLVGALPTLCIVFFFFLDGHWNEFWHAMVLSNLAKAREGQAAWRTLSIALITAPVLIFAAIGLSARSTDRHVRAFVAAWLGAALLGFVSVPNFYGHYVLPVLVPLSVAMGLGLGMIKRWPVPAAAFALYLMMWYDPTDVAWTRETNRSMLEMTRIIQEHDDGGGLLVFDAPVYLYATAGKKFLSPLVFPQHLNHQIENNVSHLNTRAEIERILARRPSVIVMSRFPRSFPVNEYTRGRVLAYIRAHCRSVHIEQAHHDPSQYEFAILGDCGGR